MGLIDRFLGGAKGQGEGNGPASVQDSRSAGPQTRSRNQPRRDLVHLALRETMRRHGIPSDWIQCRTLSVLTKHHKSGMHVQFLVRKADQQLLGYVHAFQESFWHEIEKVDPLARDWLFSVGWEFYGKAMNGFGAMPDPGAWKDAGPDTQPSELHAQPPDDDEEALATDLQALQAVMTAPAELVDLPDAPPRRHKS